MADARSHFDPLLDASPLPLGAPAFDRVTPDLFLPAFRAAIAAAGAEIEAIATDPAPPDFANTVVAMERAGAGLSRVRRLFWTLSSAQAVPEIQAIEAEIGAMLTRHGTAVAQDVRLFDRVDRLWTDRAHLSLDEAQSRLLADSHRGFVDGGARLDPEAKARFAAIRQELSALSTRFGQNVLAATAAWSMHLAAADCAGLPEAMCATTAARAAAQGLSGHVVTLGRGDVETFLAFAERRDLRERLWRAFVGRGDGGPHDNRAIAAAILSLRREQAAMLGAASYADHALVGTMAATPDAAEALLTRVWAPAVARAGIEQAGLQRLADRDGVTIAAWDWRYYAEQVRRDRYALDGAAVQQVLRLDRVRAAAFRVAGRLYGLAFSPRDDLPTWHADARAWAVDGADGEAVGLLYTDFAARPEKHGGAWMGSLRVQEALDGPVRPIAYIVANFAMNATGDAGLSIDEARTLFHEFGHALHALLSDVTYPSQAGTAVARDFVEFPSKLMEHWILVPEVLAELGMPAPLIAAIGAADAYGQGFATVEFVASALIDLALHRQPADTDPRPVHAGPARGTAHAGRHRPAARADPLHPRLRRRLCQPILQLSVVRGARRRRFRGVRRGGRPVRRQDRRPSGARGLARGDTRDPLASFVAFRGRTPDAAALLRARGLS